MKPLQEIDVLNDNYNLILGMEIVILGSCDGEYINRVAGIFWGDLDIYYIRSEGLIGSFERYRKIGNTIANNLRIKFFFCNALNNYFSERRLLDIEVRKKMLEEL